MPQSFFEFLFIKKLLVVSLGTSRAIGADFLKAEQPKGSTEKTGKYFLHKT